jgi:hypothetical protein
MTAVEWLIDQVQDFFVIPFDILEQAEEMDKQQKIDAYSHGWHDGQDVIISQVKHIDKGGDNAGEKFYNETFKK